MGIERVGSFVRAVGEIVSEITRTIGHVVTVKDNKKAEFRYLKDNISEIKLNYKNRNKERNVTSGSTTNALGPESTIGTKQHSIIAKDNAFFSSLKTKLKKHLPTFFSHNTQNPTQHEVTNETKGIPPQQQTTIINEETHTGETVQTPSTKLSCSGFSSDDHEKSQSIDKNVTNETKDASQQQQITERLVNTFMDNLLNLDLDDLPTLQYKLTTCFGDHATSVQNLTEDQKEALQKALGDIYNNDIRPDITKPNSLQQHAQQWKKNSHLLGLKYALDVALGSKTKESIEKEIKMISRGLDKKMFPLVRYGLLSTVKATYNALVPSDQRIE